MLPTRNWGTVTTGDPDRFYRRLSPLDTFLPHGAQTACRDRIDEEREPGSPTDDRCVHETTRKLPLDHERVTYFIR